MSQYEPLAQFLAAKKSDIWEASFADVEAALGSPLPRSAYRYPAWWANQTGGGHSQTRGWRSVGWRTAALDLERRRVRFERDKDARKADIRAGETKTGLLPVEVQAPLLARAREVSGIEDASQIVEEALKALIAQRAAAWLSQLGGSMPDYRAPARERPAR